MNKTCPIWGTPVERKPTTRDGSVIKSPRAGGLFFMSRAAEINFQRAAMNEKVTLTNWIVDQHRYGVEYPEITANSLDAIIRTRSLSAGERADRLLRYLNAKSDLLGHVITFYALDNSKIIETEYELLAWTASQKISEVITLAEYCNEEGWIEHIKTDRSSSSGNTRHQIMLKPPGYSRLADIDGMNSSSTQAFVAMWFDVSMNDAYDNGIAPAIEQAGYSPLRIDRKDYNNKIDDEIIAEIRRSRFLIADFTQGDTGARGGVYYEAGFAYGLNIPVIFTCQEASIREVHFDTRQYNHITWSTPDELRERLIQRIGATMGYGPLKQTHEG